MYTPPMILKGDKEILPITAGVLLVHFRKIRKWPIAMTDQSYNHNVSWIFPCWISINHGTMHQYQSFPSGLHPSQQKGSTAHYDICIKCIILYTIFLHEARARDLWCGVVVRLWNWRLRGLQFKPRTPALLGIQGSGGHTAVTKVSPSHIMSM